MVAPVPGVGSGVIAFSSRMRVRREPASSGPMKPATVHRAPSAARFSATLAAPPAVHVSRAMSTTGTGASGEMRVASPQM